MRYVGSWQGKEFDSSVEENAYTGFSCRWCYAPAESPTSLFGDWGRRVAHTMHCTADKGCVSRIFTINFQFTGNLWKRSTGAVLRLFSCICTLDLMRIINRWLETSAGGQLILNIGLHSKGCMKELPSPTGAWPTPSFMEIDAEALIFGPWFFFSLMEMEQMKSC